jgi:chemotaxis protein methyltransferase CheR
MEDPQFRQLLEFLELSWQGYRKVRKGVKKRVGRHMQGLGCRSIQAYLEQLSQKKAVKLKCDRIMGVSISRFFRDKRLWKAFEDHILPELIRTCDESVKVWSAGCACGEEVYSLKILWEKIGKTYINLPFLDIIATDINPRYLIKAKKALYPLSSLKEVPEDLRTNCFLPQSGVKRFKVKPHLKEGITWRRLNFFSDSPGTGYHLIFIRNNLLTYYHEGIIRGVFNKLMTALSRGGYLVIGSHEKLPCQSSILHPYPSLPYVFKKEG